MPVDFNSTTPIESEKENVIQTEDLNNKYTDSSDVSAPTSETPSNIGTMLDGVVNIIDPEVPLIILFGPTSCGKTMTLIRLTRYLHNELGYTVVPDETFRPSYDEAYKKDCTKFEQTVNDPIAAPGTSGYMLVDVMASGKVLCKILEAPGEYYFDPNEPNKQYPHYMNTIMMAKNRKVWCAFVEPNWKDPAVRANYVSRVSKLKPQMSGNDRMVFVFNKIDDTPFVLSPGVVNEKLAINNVRNLYPTIFEPYRCTIPIVKWFREYDCSFVPFQTGIYSRDVDSNGNPIVLYAEGPAQYAKRLWNEIKRSI